MRFCLLILLCWILAYPNEAIGQCFWPERYGEFNKQIFQSFDKGTLPKGVMIDEELRILPSGRPQILHTKSNGSVIDVFQCEQSIWEAAPFDKDPRGTPRFTCSFSDATNSRNDYISHASEEAKSKFVLLHVIPRSVLKRYPGVFSDSEIHSADNLVAISVDNLQNSRLADFREDWCKYFDKHESASAEALQTESKALREKYAELFQKP